MGKNDNLWGMTSLESNLSPSDWIRSEYLPLEICGRRWSPEVMSESVHHYSLRSLSQTYVHNRTLLFIISKRIPLHTAKAQDLFIAGMIYYFIWATVQPELIHLDIFDISPKLSDPFTGLHSVSRYRTVDVGRAVPFRPSEAAVHNVLSPQTLCLAICRSGRPPVKR